MKSSDLGPPINNGLSVTHSSQYDQFQLSTQYANVQGKTLDVFLGFGNSNTENPGPFSSLAPPPANLTLSNFNSGGSFVYYAYDQNSGGPIPGKITSLTPAGAPSVPEPTTLSLLVLAGVGIGLNKIAKRWKR